MVGFYLFIKIIVLYLNFSLLNLDITTIIIIIYFNDTLNFFITIFLYLLL